MNKSVTSREILLDAAKEIANRDGIAGISMRQVAAQCGTAVGSIYNYFPTKADLIIAVIEDFWRTAIHAAVPHSIPSGGFADFFEQLYLSFHHYLGQFSTNWLEQLSLLSTAEKQQGKRTEAQYFQHIQQGLVGVLAQDTAISPALWTAEFTRERFIRFVFENMIFMLKNDVQDCDFFKQIIIKLLYR